LKKLKVGFFAGFMDGFSNEGLKKFEEYQKELLKISKKMNFELIVLPTIIKSMVDAVKVRKQLDEKDIDFALLFHPSYIVGDFIYEIMKSRAYFGLWAIEELSDEGPMPLASLVNIEQNASIAIHNFKGNPKKTKWFFGDINKRYFMNRFEITIKSLTAVKNLKYSKVAQIGKLADGHINHMVDPRQIYKNIGVDVTRDFEVEDIIKMGEEIDNELVEKKVLDITSHSKISRVGMDKITDSVKMYFAIKKLCNENDYSAVAFSCWPKLMPLKEMSGCLVNSLLNSDGIAAGCEADVLSTISMLILSHLSQDITAVMDLPKFDDKDNSLLLWHCGSAPFEMANQRGVICEKHYFADYEETLKKCGPVTDMIFSKNEVTVFRLTGDSESFYYFTGNFFDEEKKSFCGSRGWVNNLKLYNEPIDSIDLINTLLVNGLPHHFPIVQKDVSKYLEEFAYWSGLKKIKRFNYKDYLYV
jgi:L-fucose isomerase-like protein